MLTTLAIAALGACILGLIASLLMTRASNLSAAWNIAIAGGVALTLAAVLYLLVRLIVWMAFG
jgi:hypothetical protein